MAAYSAGVTTVLIPADNAADLEEIDPLARENLTFVPCRTVNEVLDRALCPLPTEAEVSEAPAAEPRVAALTGAETPVRPGAVVS